MIVDAWLSSYEPMTVAQEPFIMNMCFSLSSIFYSTFPLQADKYLPKLVFFGLSQGQGLANKPMNPNEAEPNMLVGHKN